VVAEIVEPGGASWTGACFGTRLAAAGTAVAELAGTVDQLSYVADDDIAGVMGELTTLVGQLDGLRVEVARAVRTRGLYRLRGARNVDGWLRADARTADDAWKLSRLSAKAHELPRITGLLAEGSVSLTQAGAACWQISQLPDIPRKPEEADPPGPDVPAAGSAGPDDELWAGLWRGGDVHAAADQLFAQFMPGMDGQQLRVLGAHLRDAADAQERAGEDYDDFAKRAVRISRSLGGAGELSGRLHAEAAEQVIAAFEELGGKSGPDDKRTKAQRWADVLTRLAGLAGPALAGNPAEPAEAAPADLPSAPDETPTAAPPAAPDETPAAAPSTEADDDQPCADEGHGHQSPAGHGHDRPAGLVPAGFRRPRVIVTVPLWTLLGKAMAPGAVLGSGTPITGEAARRIGCDAEIVRVITDLAPELPDGSLGRGLDATAQLTALLAGAIAQLPHPLGGPSAVLDIGRKSPGWTPRQRDALYAQYGGQCGRPGCTSPIDVIHHVIHWVEGGKTRIGNGAPLCKYDHWLVHEGGWRVKKQPGGALTFFPPPRGWRPGTVYRSGKPVPEVAAGTDAP
jgi:hypothetical protein